jgi:hypothetical protein
MTKINKSELLEYHSLTKNDVRTKENSVSKIEKVAPPKNFSIKSFVPNQKLTKKLSETNNTQDLYLTTDMNKNFKTTKNSPQKTNCFKSNIIISNKKNDNSLQKSILIKEETKQEITLEAFVSELDKFNNHYNNYNSYINYSNCNDFNSNFNKIFQIFESINLEENKKISYTQIWKKFLSNVEKFFYKNSNIETVKNEKFPKKIKEISKPKQTIHAYNNISHLNNNNFNFQIVEVSNLELEKLKKKLAEKEKEIKELKSMLETKDQKLIDLEKTTTQITKEKEGEIKNMKNNYMSNNEENSEIDKDHEELLLYQNKQLMRDYKNLSSENKNLRDFIAQLEKDMKTSKDKEVKIMHILYTLKKKGVAIENLLSEEFPKELAEISLNFKANRKYLEIPETSRSLDNSMYTPICIDSPCYFKKPDKIPSLNLDNINSLYNK